MRKFSVWDNNKPASIAGFPKLNPREWATSEFDTLVEAQTYMAHWLGMLSPHFRLLPNQPYDYSGYGDMIEIREES